MLWKVYRTIQQMLFDRKIEFEGEIIQNEQQFEVKFGRSELINWDSISFVTLCPRVGVFFAEPDTILVEHIRKYQQSMSEENLQHAILVTKSTLSSQCRKLLHDSKLHVEAFKESELLINVTRHVLVPQHEKVAKNELQLPAQTIHHLPKLNRGDPVARYYSFHSGDIIKITRSSPTAGVSQVYRVVV